MQTRSRWLVLVVLVLAIPVFVSAERRTREDPDFIGMGLAAGGDTELAVTYGRIGAVVQRIRGSREIEDKVFVVEGEVTVQLEATGPSPDSEDTDEQTEMCARTTATRSCSMGSR